MPDIELVDVGSHRIDKEKLEQMLPKGVNSRVTNEIIELIGKMEDDTGIFQDYMEESLLSHLPVLKEVKVSLRDYINAIKFCNLKRSMSNDRAWAIVFPEKYQRLVESGRDPSSHVAMYNQSKIVTKLDASMMIDIKIQYAPILHKAIRKQVELMSDPDVSPHVQHLASKTLIETLKPIEEQNIALKIGPSDEAIENQNRMFDQMRKIAENQQRLLAAGHPIEDIQKLNMKIEVEDVQPV